MLKKSQVMLSATSGSFFIFATVLAGKALRMLQGNDPRTSDCLSSRRHRDSRENLSSVQTLATNRRVRAMLRKLFVAPRLANRTQQTSDTVRLIRLTDTAFAPRKLPISATLCAQADDGVAGATKGNIRCK